MRSDARKSFDNLYGFVEKTYRVFSRRLVVKKTLKAVRKPLFDFDKEYKEKVIPYWKQYGIKPKKYWWFLYSEGKKELDPRYIPDDLYFGDILPYFSNMSFRRSMEDKCFHETIFKDLLRPRTVCKNVAGVNYDSAGNIISKEELISVCEREEKFIIKPSIDSGTGRLIEFYDAKVDSRERIKKLIELFDSNFIVQEIVDQHAELKRINESSLNTVRILSFLFEGQVHILSSILRMGAKDSKVDNVSAGGIQCGINDDGTLFPLAADKKRNWVDRHPSGIKFSDVNVPSYNKVVEIVKKEHKRLAHFKLIGWDFAINKDGAPVFIEYNVCPGANQMTCGPTFGDLTERVLEDVFIKKTYANANN